MKYINFYQKLKDAYPILSRKDINKVVGEDILDTQLSSWVKKSLLVKPRRDIYLLKDNENVDRFLLANKLFEPSYVSLESALFYYGLIPDVVAAVTSVTSKKTRRFDFNNQLFLYQKIKSNLFFGYGEIKTGEWGFLLASPEKAILDYFYLNFSRLKSTDSWDELRIDKKTYKAIIKRPKLFKYLRIFDLNKFEKIIKQFDKYIRQ